jgi:hypothetical protein
VFGKILNAFMKNYLASLLGVGIAASAIHPVLAAEHKEARVTQKVNDVRVLAANTASRPAAVNENVHQGNAVRTGTESRAELMFVDQTIARLGANTVFNVGTESRTYDLDAGVILVYAPKTVGSVKIIAAGATAGISGGTAMFEFHRDSLSKFIILEGEGTFAIKGNAVGPCRLHAGQMIVIPPHPTRCPEIYNIDLGKLIKTAKLITKFPPLPSLGLILQEIAAQQASPPPGRFVNPTGIDKIDQANAARPPKPPPVPIETPPP